jgi:hypothetical protein
MKSIQDLEDLTENLITITATARAHYNERSRSIADGIRAMTAVWKWSWFYWEVDWRFKRYRRNANRQAHAFAEACK